MNGFSSRQQKTRLSCLVCYVFTKQSGSQGPIPARRLPQKFIQLRVTFLRRRNISTIMLVNISLVICDNFRLPSPTFIIEARATNKRTAMQDTSWGKYPPLLVQHKGGAGKSPQESQNLRLPVARPKAHIYYQCQEGRRRQDRDTAPSPVCPSEFCCIGFSEIFLLYLQLDSLQLRYAWGYRVISHLSGSGARSMLGEGSTGFS